jgi:protein-arginine kinase activator protein McsA
MARTLHCQNCGKNDSTVCAAHSNWAGDIYISSLCHDCHMELDQGKTLSKDERKKMWTNAHIKTMSKLVELGYAYPKD